MQFWTDFGIVLEPSGPQHPCSRLHGSLIYEKALISLRGPPQIAKSLQNRLQGLPNAPQELPQELPGAPPETLRTLLGAPQETRMASQSLLDPILEVQGTIFNHFGIMLEHISSYFRDIFSTQHTAHHTAHSTQHTAHSTQHTAHSTQHTAHSTHRWTA